MEQVKIGKIDLMSEISTFKEQVKKERADRVISGKDPLSFGISYLDDATGGIYKNDLIIIGAKTGIGKTELVAQVAMVNAIAGKKVHFFALEAEKYEIERRIKFKYLSRMYHEVLHGKVPDFYFNYRDWYYGKLEKEIGPYEPEIEEMLGDQLVNLNTFYRSFGEYTVYDFEKQFLAIKDETDLVIVDHLHYFDHDDINEQKAVRDTVKKLRDLALSIGKPVLLVCHLRKSDKASKRIIPDVEDFHGTSEIGKIATKAIVLAHPKDQAWARDNIPTLIQVAKSRVSSEATRYAGLCSFNPTRNNYDHAYYTGKVEEYGTEISYISNNNDLPRWARKSLLMAPEEK